MYNLSVVFEKKKKSLLHHASQRKEQLFAEFFEFMMCLDTEHSSTIMFPGKLQALDVDADITQGQSLLRVNELFR